MLGTVLLTVLQIAALPESRKGYFRERLEKTHVGMREEAGASANLSPTPKTKKEKLTA
jgi:hypothetical protein